MIGIKESQDKQYNYYHNRRYFLIREWLWQLNIASFPKQWGTYDNVFQVFWKYKLLYSFVLLRVTFKKDLFLSGPVCKEIFEPQDAKQHCVSSNKGMEVFSVMVVTTSSRMGSKKKLCEDLIPHILLAWKLWKDFSTLATATSSQSHWICSTRAMAANMHKLIAFSHLFNLSDQACSVTSLQLSVDIQINKQLKSNHVLISLIKLKGLPTLSAYCFHKLQCKISPTAIITQTICRFTVQI